MVEEDEKEENIQLVEDDIFASILKEIEMENSKTESSHMVGNCENIKALCWGVQGSTENNNELTNCKIIEDYGSSSSSQLSTFDVSSTPQPLHPQAGSDDLWDVLNTHWYQGNEKSGDAGDRDCQWDH